MTPPPRARRRALALTVLVACLASSLAASPLAAQSRAARARARARAERAEREARAERAAQAAAEARRARRPLWGPLEPGPFAVGFETLDGRDTTRSSGGAPRPLQVGIWYPARADGSGEPLRFADYAALSGRERTLGVGAPADDSAAVARLAAFLARNGGDSAAVTQWMAAPVVARRGASRQAWRSPLVLIAQGSFETVYSQAVLAECLASHGYVVATSPAPLRLADPDSARPPVLALARAQAADLRWIAHRLARDPRVDSTRVGVVAHSFGARAGLLLALPDEGWRPIRALVSLDGGIASTAGRDWLDSARVDTAAVTAPILHFWQAVDTTVVFDPSFLERLRGADRTVVRADSLFHLDFTTVGNARAWLPALAFAPRVSALDERIAAVNEAVLVFLDATLAPVRPRPIRGLVTGRATRWLHPVHLAPGAEHPPPS